MLISSMQQLVAAWPDGVQSAQPGKEGRGPHYYFVASLEVSKPLRVHIMI